MPCGPERRSEIIVLQIWKVRFLKAGRFLSSMHSRFAKRDPFFCYLVSYLKVAGECHTIRFSLGALAFSSSIEGQFHFFLIIGRVSQSDSRSRHALVSYI